MTEVCYEVRLSVDAAIQAEFDAWLAGHVRRMLGLPGFQRARLLTPEPGADGRHRRIVRYKLASRAALERYFRAHAARMRAEALEQFGDRFQVERDIYDLAAVTTLPPEPVCPNCHAVAGGAYCAACGQKRLDQS